MSELPEGVSSAMFLRDGWPHAVVCKVVMRDGCVGIGIYRQFGSEAGPARADELALENAISCVSPKPPDYRDLHDHIARMKAEAEARVAQSMAATVKGETIVEGALRSLKES